MQHKKKFAIVISRFHEAIYIQVDKTLNIKRQERDASHNKIKSHAPSKPTSPHLIDKLLNISPPSPLIKTYTYPSSFLHSPPPAFVSSYSPPQSYRSNPPETPVYPSLPALGPAHTSAWQPLSSARPLLGLRGRWWHLRHLVSFSVHFESKLVLGQEDTLGEKRPWGGDTNLPLLILLP